MMHNDNAHHDAVAAEAISMSIEKVFAPTEASMAGNAVAPSIDVDADPTVFSSALEQQQQHVEACIDAAQTHHAKLFGRSVEQQQLLEAYHRFKNRAASGHQEILSSCEVVLVSGPAGIGKTGLAFSMRHQVENVDHGYILCSKFHQMQRPEPHIAFVEAITEFVAHVLDRGHTDALSYRDAIATHCPEKQGGTSSTRTTSMPDGGYQALCETFPAIKSLFDSSASDQNTSTTKETQSLTNSENPSVELESDEEESHQKVAVLLSDQRLLKLELGQPPQSQQQQPQQQQHQYSIKAICRFKDALRSLLRAIATVNKPLVWIMDDIQWADEYSLLAIQILFSDQSLGGSIMFIGTYRGHMDAPTERIPQTMGRLYQPDVTLTRIQLAELGKDDICDMLTYALQASCSERVKPLASYIHGQTGGNVYFVWELLRQLKNNDQLRLDDSSGHTWKADAMPETLSLHGLIQTKMNGFDAADVDHLKIAACLGGTLHRSILSRLMATSERSFESLVSHAESNGLVRFDGSRRCWTFAHDVVRDAVYDMVPDPDRRAFHYRLGRKLWRILDRHELGQFIFLVVDQLTYSIDGLVEDKERTAVAKLCLCAGIQAVKLSSFFASLDYLERGLSLIGPRSWRDDYDLCIDLYSAAAEVANSLGRFERVYEIVGSVVENGRSFCDTLRAQSAMVHALGSSGNFPAAMKLGFDLLGKLGERFTKNPSRLRIAVDFVSLRRRLKRMSNEAVLRLEHMVDNDKLAVMQLLNLVFFYAMIQSHENVPLIGFRLVELTLDYGLCTVSCVGFVLVAGTLCGAGRDFKEGHRIAQLAFALYEKFGNKAWLARLSVLYFDFVHGWVYPLDSCRDELEYACQAGLDSGDVEFALGCEMVSFYCRFEYEHMSVLIRQWNRLKQRIDFYGHAAMILMTVAPRQLMQNLTDLEDTRDPHILEGAFLDASCASMMASNRLMDAWYQIQATLLSLLFGRYQEAAATAKKGRVLATNMFGPHCGGFNLLVCGLADVLCAQHGRSRLRRRSATFAKRCSKSLRFSADHGEALYFVSKHYLLEAELAALAGRNDRAFTLYMSAISTSKNARLRMQTALANERTARFLWEQGDVRRAHVYFKESIVWYKDWGAVVKVQHLEQEMREFGLDLSCPLPSMAGGRTMNYFGVYQSL